MSENRKIIRKERRNKLEIYFDILRSIELCSFSFELILPTQIQQQSNLSHDKFTRYLKDLENKKMITKNPMISLSTKGKQFLKEYQGIKEFMEKLGLDYLN